MRGNALAREMESGLILFSCSQIFLSRYSKFTEKEVQDISCYIK